ncbi:MAG: hypothetical protein ACRDMV_14330, partial [Streptosporangiales bacterium]
MRDEDLPVLIELDILHRCLLDTQQPSPYHATTHAVLHSQVLDQLATQKPRPSNGVRLYDTPNPPTDQSHEP